MKNKIIILLTVFFFISCSNLKKQETGEEKKYKVLLNEWKLDELESVLNHSSSEEEIRKKYRNLLQMKRAQQKKLEDMLTVFKAQLEINDFKNIEKYFDDTFVNRKILSEIKNIDFSKIKIVYTKPEFYKENAVNNVAFLFSEEVQYFHFTYRFSNNQWKIAVIEDGR